MQPALVPEEDRRFVTALSRGLDLLRCFTPESRWIGIVEIARRTGLPKATVARLAFTLCSLGYLEYSKERGKYALGIGVLSLGFSLLSSMEIRRIARPFMLDFAEQARASVSLGARDGLEMVYIENCRSAAPLVLGIGVGARVPLAKTSIGRAWLCAIDETERAPVMDRMRKEDPRSWPQRRDEIERAVAQYQDNGYVTSVGEWESDINAAGCPLVLPDGATVLAFNCGGPASRLTPDVIDDEIGPKLVTMVNGVRRALGMAARR